MKITRRQLVHGMAAGAAAAVLPLPALAQVADVARTGMAPAAAAFLAGLGADGRRRAMFAFEDKERLNWHYVPRGREGVAFKDMAPATRNAAHELMKASLSAAGYAKALQVIQTEEELRRISSSMTTPRTTPITYTRSGTMRGATSGSISCAPTTRPAITTRRQHPLHPGRPR